MAFTTTLEEETWSAPEVPDYVQELGESMAAGGGRSAAQSGNGKVDTFTPWEELGGFRMGR